MGLKEEWESLSGDKKMMIVGGGGLAVFFLITAIKNKMSGNSQGTTQNTTQQIDPSSSLDAMTSQMQDLQNQIQAMQDSQTTPTDTGTNQQDLLNQYQNYVTSMMTKNQDQTNSEIKNLINRMGSSKNPTTTPKPVAVANPIKGPTYPVNSKEITYTAFGKTALNSSLWGLSKMYLMNHGGLKNPTNSQIQTEVNKVVNLNHVKNPNVIQKGQKFKMN